MMRDETAAHQVIYCKAAMTDEKCPTCAGFHHFFAMRDQHTVHSPLHVHVYRQQFGQGLKMDQTLIHDMESPAPGR